MTQEYSHQPVLLKEALAGLSIQPGGVYVDGTFGRGGHAGAILAMLGPEGKLLAMDKDPDAVRSATHQFGDDPRFEIEQGSFVMLGNMLEQQHLQGQVNGLLLDLGVSSPQLDDASRGFSFSEDGPLDMRMDPDTGRSAADWLQSVEEKFLKQILFKYGEERDAARIAKAIVIAREQSAISTTLQLAEIVASVVPAHTRKKHPATKTFQAIRIFINDELGQIEAALQQSLDVLKRGGRLCVISFHSLEDRLVKRFMRDASRESEQYRGMPNVPEEFRPKMQLIGKAVSATAAEISDNPRARSARLRIAERL